MRVIRGFPLRSFGPVALTIGNFDGVHRGHQAMIDRLTEAAEDLGLPSAVMTFEPHPRDFFSRARDKGAPPRLSTLRDKLEQFAELGVTETIVARFNAQLASVSAEDFVEKILVQRLATRWVLVGDDFRFGRGRAGDLSTLRAMARSFSVEGMSTIEIDGKRASSTEIRTALANGNLEAAAHLLGRPYAISGHVVHGDKLGRDLGFPTANLALPFTPALTGIFAVCVHGLGDPRSGVASLGVRPTVKNDAKPLLEVYVLDYNESFYGRRIKVDFLHKLRDEARYPSLDALTAQIEKDVAMAREFFSSQAAA